MTAQSGTPTRVAVLLGLVLLATGAILGLTHLSVAGLDGTYQCGSAFQGNGYAARQEVDQYVSGLEGGSTSLGSALVAECDSKRSDRRTLAIVLLVAGGVSLFGARFVAPTSQGRTIAGASDPSPTVEP